MRSSTTKGQWHRSLLISQVKKYDKEFAVELWVPLWSVDILMFQAGNIFANLSSTLPNITYLVMGHPSSSD